MKPNGKSIKPIAASGQMSTHPAVSRDGKRLLYSEIDGGVFDIGRIKIPNQKAVFPREIIAYQGHDCWPDVSPDGKYVTFVSPRSGYSEVWKCGFNGENPQQLTTLENYSGRPRWSPDGQHIVFDSRPDGQSDIYIVSANGGVPNRLTHNPLDEVLPNWSRDGQWIYYCITSQGDNQIYKVPVGGGSSQQVTSNGGLMAFESMDGEFLYVQKLDDPGIWRCRLDGSGETLVAEHGNDYRKWYLYKDGIYYFTHNAEDSVWALNFYHFSNKDVLKVATIENVPNMSGPVLSPDGQYLYFHYIGEKAKGDIYLVENFE